MDKHVINHVKVAFMKKNIAIRIFFCCICIFLLLSLIACTASPSEPETITLDAIYNKTEISLDITLSSLSSIVYNKNLYVCGQIDGSIAIATISGSETAHVITDVTAPALAFCMSNDNYVVITNTSTIPNSSSYTLSLVAKNGTTTASYTLPIILSESQELHCFLLKDIVVILDGEKCIFFNLSEGTIEIPFYFDTYGSFAGFSDTQTYKLLLFKNLYGETACYTFDDSFSLKNFDLIDLNKIKTANTLFISSESECFFGNTQGIYSAESGNLILSWINSNINSNYITDIVMLDPSTIYMLYRSDNSESVKLFILSPSSVDESHERTVIRVSYYESGSKTIPQAALLFNSMSSKYYVICDEQATVFTESSDQINAMMSEFDKAILSNKVGDVIILNSDFRTYADKGIFCDLYDFMINDPELKNDKFFDCVINSLEYKQKLYVLTPSFRIKTLVGKASNFSTTDWSCSDFISFSNSIDKPNQLLAVMSRSNLTNILYNSAINSFVDIQTATCNFSDAAFSEILNYLSELPEEAPLTYSIADCVPYQNDTYLLYNATICNLADYLALKVRFGHSEDLLFVGYPSNTGGVSQIQHSDYYAISNTSQVKEGAWEFIKFLTMNCLSIHNLNSYIPSMKQDVFQEWCTHQQNYDYLFEDGALYTAVDPSLPSNSPTLSITPEVITEFYSIVESTTPIKLLPSTINEIITEETSSYFSGVNSINQTIKYIQSRVEIYLNENK